MEISVPRLLKQLISSSIGRRLLSGSLWGILGAVVSRLLMLLLMIFVARVLGRIEFGQLGIVQSTLGVAGLMAGLGLGSTATRFVAQFSKADPKRAGHVISLVIASAGLSLMGVAALFLSVSDMVASEVIAAPELTSALNVGLLLMAATAFRGIQNGILAGFERFDSIAKLNIIDAIVCFGAGLILATQLGLIGVLAGLAIGSAIALFCGQVFLTGELKSRNIKLDYKNCWKEWPVLSGYSAPSLLANLVATPALWIAMTLVANSRDGYGGLGIYNAAYQWHGPLVFLPMILTSVSIPLLVQEWEVGNKRSFRNVIFSLCGIIIVTALPVVIVLSIFSERIMSLYGAGFSEGALLLVILLLAAPFHGISKIVSSALLAMNKAWWVFWVNLCWAIAVLSFTVMLLPEFGALGLAFAFCISYAVLAGFSLSLILSVAR